MSYGHFNIILLIINTFNYIASILELIRGLLDLNLSEIK